MEIICESCGHQIPYDHERPRFCGHCGVRLQTEADAHEAETVPPKSKKRAPRFRLDTPPEVVGRYRIEKQIGSGGMGVVYEATETDTGRRVALKLLSSALCSDATNVERFVREGRLAAQLSHPRTTFIYEAGEEQGRPFIAMELMPGLTLQDELTKNGPMDTGKAVDHILDVIEGLIAAHRLNVIHRDVKPSNCFIDIDGRIKVGDFGLSKSLVTDANLTRTGAFMGTPSYAAPEQIRGADVNQQTDVYAVGATLFTLIANRPPFVGDAMSVTAQIISDKPESIRSLVKRVPRDLAEVIDRALRKNPADRFDNLEQMRRALVPFATRGTSLADFGRRSAAYMIDYLMITVFIQVIMGVIGGFIGVQAQIRNDQLIGNGQIAMLTLISVIGAWATIVLYFTITEGFWGRSIGKRLLGLFVVNMEGERPGPLRTFIRSLAIPGAFGIPVIVMVLRWRFVDMDVQLTSVQGVLTTWFIDKAAEFLPILGCALTMRANNGLRGVHGLLSGTRVLHVSARYASQLQSRLPKMVVEPRPEQAPATLGPFKVVGLLSQFQGRQVFLGADESLDRKVWIFCSPGETVHHVEHRNLNRATRCRWLQGGELSPGRWDAFEYVDGVPFEALLDKPRLFTWENTRRAVAGYVKELDVSSRQDTLPGELSLSQFWIERSGQGKILDLSMTGEPSLESSAQVDDQRVYDLLERLFEPVVEKQTLPVTVDSLLRGFQQGAKRQLMPLSQLASQLHASLKQLGELRWDSRLAVLGVTVGVEWVMYYGLLMWFCWLTFSSYDASYPVLQLTLQLSVPVVFFSLAFFVIGFAMRGAPVFRFMRIDIHHRKGGLASRTRCGARNLVAWLPFALTMTGGQTFLNFGMKKFQERVGNNTTNLQDFQEAFDFESFPILLLIVMGAVVVTTGIMAFGAIVSVWSSKRGIQDWICGTRLVPH